MSDTDVDGGQWDSPDDSPEEGPAVASTEAYETESGVVLYDADNPLAWIQSDSALTREEMA
jgi:hypothetical protein